MIRKVVISIFFVEFIYIRTPLAQDTYITSDKIKVESTVLKTPEEELESKDEIIVENGTELNLPELIQFATGITVNYYGDKFGYSTVSIRGSSHSQVDITLNGLPLSLDPEGDTNLGIIPVTGIKKIVIYKGLNFEGGDIFLPGGSIDLITQLKTNNENKSLNFSVGSWISNDDSLSRVLKFSALRYTSIWFSRPLYKNLWLSLGSDWSYSEGDFKFLFDNGTLLNEDDDYYTYRKNNLFNRISFFSSIFTENKDGTQNFSLINRTYSIERGIPGFASIETKETSFYSLSSLWQAIYSKKGGIGKKIPYNLVISTQFHYQNRLLKDINGELGLGSKFTEIKGFNLSVVERIKIFFYPLWISELFGVHLYTWDPEDKLTILNEDWRWNRLTFSLKLTIGFVIKENLYLISATGFSFNTDFILKGIEQPLFYYKEFPELSSLFFFTPHIGLYYKPLSIFTLKTNFYYQERPPTIIELFGNQGVVIPAGKLKPEHGWTVEIGTELNWKNIVTKLCFFYRMVEDLIQFVQNSQSTFVAENVGKANFIGTELFFKFPIIYPYIETFIAYTYNKSENQTPISYLKGKYIALTPVHTLKGGIEFRFWRFKLFYFVDFKGDFYLDNYNSYPLPYHLKHNIELGYNHSQNQNRSFEISIRVTNLGDKLTEYIDFEPVGRIRRPVVEINGFPLPGRTLFITFKLNLP